MYKMVKKSYNYSINKKILGIEILRVILSFMVVLDHLYKGKNFRHYYYIIYYHIPTFFLISFFFTYKTFTSFNINKIKSRLERLFIPYFSWTIIPWILNFFYFYILDFQRCHSIEFLIISLINGHELNSVLWFQNILILLTILFLIVIFIFKKKYFIIFYILTLSSYSCQYSGINFIFFTSNFKGISAATFGRFVEAFPNAIIGFYLSSIDIITKAKKNIIKVSFICITTLVFITKYHYYDKLDSLYNFRYAGFRLNIAAICIFIFFSLLPFEKIKSKIIINIISKITSYTGGIYFIHKLLGKGYFCSHILRIKRGNLFFCIIIYLLSYIISAIGFNLSKKIKLKHNFS